MSAVVHNEAPSRLRRGMPDPVPVVLLPSWPSIEPHAAEFYRHFDFHDLDSRLWRRLSDAAATLEA